MKTVFVTLLKRPAMQQSSWSQAVVRITAVLQAHTSYDHMRRWLSPSDADDVSVCWQLLIDVDQQQCVQQLLRKMVDVYSLNAFVWATAHVTFVNTRCD